MGWTTKNNLLRCAGLVLSILPCLAVAEGSAAWEWLQRMNSAVRSTNYVGSAVLHSGDHTETLRVVHRYQDGVESERVLSLSGEVREVLRSDGLVRVGLPERGIQIIEDDPGRGLLPTLGESARDGLARHYKLSLLSKPNRVAGRVTREIHIEARDDWRWGYRIKVDAENAMPLHLEVRNAKQDVLEKIEFVTVEFPDMLSDAVMQAQIDVSKLQRVRADKSGHARPEQDVLSAWQVANPPPGFRLSAREWARIPGGAHAVAHWVYTDGLASISIYASPVSAGGQVPEAGVRSGAVSTVRKMSGAMMVTAMGEVPLQTARRFGESLEPVEQAQATP